MNVLWQWTTPLVRLFYPHLCEACGEELVGNEHLLCISCWSKLPETKFHLQANNPVEQRFWGRFPLEYAGAMYYFHKDTRLQEALHALKYRGVTDLGVEMGRRFGREIEACSWVKDIDLLLPVPLSERKRRQRGFNQSDFIAKGLGDILHLPVDTQSLRRVKHTESQTHKSRIERLENMERAFSLKDPEALSGRHVCLVDDVITTGATLEACALALQQQGRVRISILALAYAIE